MRYCGIYETKIGPLTVVADENQITEISFGRNRRDEFLMEETGLISMAQIQLFEYLDGGRTEFDLPLKMEGTEFQKKVWQALLTIPYGETRSYMDIANQIGNPKACRAVGMANHANPISIVVPCHRVIGKNGSLTGYGGGLPTKEILLKLEQDVLKIKP